MSDAVTRLNDALEGRYVIEREIGEGGMATVYLAKDLRHNRSVALKVLKPELAAVVGADRFLAEIETTAGLQHPHILPLFDSGEADGFLFYVMPYIEGETLRERIDTERQLPVDEALGIATAVAAALQTAHDQGVVHRDIKPGNILLSRGQPLVADFGIALAVSAGGGGRLTETGLSMGTPYYMSPEQATGDQAVGPASDTFALACVLYEMLVGEPPYPGNTAQAVLGKIIQGVPVSATSVRKSIPANVDAAIRKALEKLPADRFTGAQDFARALADPGFRHGDSLVAGDADGVVRWKRSSLVGWGTATVLAAGLGWALAQPRSFDEVERQRVVFGSGITRLPQSVSERLAIAPDGSGILFADTVDTGAGVDYGYWWKATEESDPIRIPNMDGALAPVFSPDAEWVAYVVDGELRKQPLLGGTTVLLADGVVAAGAQALAWLEGGALLFENSGPIVEWISDDGVARRTVSDLEGSGYPIHASGLPGGEAALISSCVDASCAAYRLYLLDLERDTVAPLADDVLRAWPGVGDWVIYADRRGAVFTARLDRTEMRLEPPVPLFDGVATVGATPTTAQMEVGADGTLIYLRGQATTASGYRVVWVDRQGRVEPVDPGWRRDEFDDPALSPENDRLAITIASQIWVKELPDGPLSQITVEEGVSERPGWTAGGDSIVYRSNDGGHGHVRILRADGSSPAPDTLLIIERDIFHALPPDDSGRVVFRAGTAGLTDVGYADIDEVDAIPVWLIDSEFDERAPHLSPDGRWLAYASDRSGRVEVYVRPFPDVGTQQITVSTNGGTEPLWGHSGSELFFRDGDGWMTSASFATEPTVAVTARARLFDATGFRSSTASRLHDITLDDQRFVMLQIGDVQQMGDVDLIMVQNWFREVREATER